MLGSLPFSQLQIWKNFATMFFICQKKTCFGLYNFLLFLICGISLEITKTIFPKGMVKPSSSRYWAVDSISKLGGPSSKESASNEAFYYFYQWNLKRKTGWAMAHPAHPLATAQAHVFWTILVCSLFLCQEKFQSRICLDSSYLFSL